MKKLLALILATIMVLGLVACGAKEAEVPSEPAAEEKTEAPAEQKVEEKEDAPEESAEKVLDVAFFTGGYGDMWQELLDLYSSIYPDVEIIADLSADNHTRVRTRLLSGDAPDVFFTQDGTGGQGYDPYQIAASGLMMPLDDFFATECTADGIPFTEVLDESTIENGKVLGACYLPSICTSYGGWWYDEAMFEANGWEVPATWDEYLALAPKMLEAGVTPFIYQNPNYLSWGYVYQAIAAAGGYDAWRACFVDLEEGAWEDDAVLYMAEMLDNLVEDGFMYEGVTGMDFTQTQMEFIQGNVAMIPCGSWFENEMAANTPEGFKMRLSALPMQDESGSQYLCQFGTPISIAADAKHPQEAKDFLGVVYSKEGQKILAKYGQLPVAKNVTAEDVSEYFTETMAQVVDAAAAGNVKFVNNNPQSWYPSLWEPLSVCLTDLVLQDITPEEFCAQMEEAVEEIRNDESIIKYYSYEH